MKYLNMLIEGIIDWLIETTQMVIFLVATLGTETQGGL